jgi:Domain of unknown function (DUF4189)
MRLSLQRAAFVSVGAVVLALLTPFTVRAASLDYGSIAYSVSKKVAIGALSDSKDGAINTAFLRCATEGGAPDCYAVEWFKDAYGAFALDKNQSVNPAWGVGWGSSSSDAENWAIHYCELHGGTGCTLISSASVHTQNPSSAAAGESLAPPGQLRLPFASGETWWVCQGYNGQASGTHNNIPALDLTVREQDVGPNGCWGEQNASTGRSVTAPDNGTATTSGSDGVCLNLDTKKSMWIGHLVNRVSGPVQRGDELGKVEPPVDGSPNGNYAHIHIEVHPDAGCAGSPIPFDDANATRLIGTQELPYSGEVNQYRGLQLSSP